MSRSNKSSPSPPQGLASQPGESKLPEGSCHYLLPQQELKGQRCGCVQFTLNKSIPSAYCVCGHQSCFHTNEPYVPERDYLAGKLRALQISFTTLEESFVARLSALEELVEKSREEASLEIKGAYQNLSRAWHSIGEVERQNHETQIRLSHHSERIEHVEDEVRRLDNRQLELNDVDIGLEERIEALEDLDESSTPTRHRRTSDHDVPMASHPGVDVPLFPRVHAAAPAIRPRRAPTSAPEGNNLWTVHISLLPTSALPFPFERNTNAYKRCLSRGLHQMVVINDRGAEAFNSAVSKAFSSLLQGRPWMPLQAELCNAETLQGLPMIRRLDESLIHGRYDFEFLHKHCAVLDSNGLIDSLYIAMRFDTLSWHALRRAPVFLPGLEPCWAWDAVLDRDDDAIDDSDRPSAGEILPPALTTNLKRAASEMSRSSSFGSGTAPGVAAAAIISEGEGSRPKVARVVPNMNENRRRVETV
ncbi:hypothetical protein MAPG_03925 [Magnaporthiopsis poae ATCC 64411]|uniref:Uncharacterized protein n=1 Tax=Magnaporthiopsis poae (strain ATCC 64411 / 73-15) TaxID=644358 RepID=A0A0C4DVC3_MAGP6|nr:hypothetical protein MAPG_03925 [Magnaporthiopsis poae ATCC 64411]